MNAFRPLLVARLTLALALLAASQAHAQAAGDAVPGKAATATLSARASNSPRATGPARAGAELSMIELQSVASKRATQLQLTTGMMQSLNESTKNAAGNIEGGGKKPPAGRRAGESAPRSTSAAAEPVNRSASAARR